MHYKTSADASEWAPASEEYFSSFRNGIYDEVNHLQLILPIEKSYRDPRIEDDLVVGHAGVDGIYFCFRRGHQGVWAYYGIEDEHVLKAPTLAELVRRWEDGRLVL